MAVSNFFIKNRLYTALLLALAVLYTACKKPQNYSALVTIPQHEWPANSRFRTRFNIDSAGTYRMVAIVRHSDKYDYHNLVTNLVMKDSSQKIIENIQLNMPLTTTGATWAGNKMDDLYDRQFFIKDIALQPGAYTATWQQLMQANPLSYIYNIGLLLYKK